MYHAGNKMRHGQVETLTAGTLRLTFGFWMQTDRSPKEGGPES